MITILIEWHLILIVLISLALGNQYNNAKEGDDPNIRRGVVAIMMLIIWLIYGGIVWW